MSYRRRSETAPMVAGEHYTVEDRGYKTPCHIWARHVLPNGYGQAWDTELQTNTTAHRVAWKLAYGCLPTKELDHLCRQRACVNIQHLEDVTHALNDQRGSNSKLTKESISEIFSLRKQGWLLREIGDTFGVHRQTIADVLRGATWRDVSHGA